MFTVGVTSGQTELISNMMRKRSVDLVQSCSGWFISWSTNFSTGNCWIQILCTVVKSGYLERKKNKKAHQSSVGCILHWQFSSWHNLMHTSQRKVIQEVVYNVWWSEHNLCKLHDLRAKTKSVVTGHGRFWTRGAGFHCGPFLIHVYVASFSPNSQQITETDSTDRSLKKVWLNNDNMNKIGHFSRNW